MLTQIQTSFPTAVIRDVKILDVIQGNLLGPTNVLVREGIIEELDAALPPGDCDIIEGEGRTLIPGLIDCHAHILSPFLSEQKGIPGVWALRQMHRNLEDTLAAGIVCVRDMLSPIKIMNRVRRKVADGRLIGPDILAAGAVLSCRDGYPEFIHPMPFPFSALFGQPKLNLQTPKKAADMVRYQKKCGCDLAKVGYTSYTREFTNQGRMPTISDEVFDAICATAHELGLKVSVHHNWAEDLPRILRADIDTLEHLIFERDITDDLAAAVKEKGVTVVPTLTVTEGMARFEDKLQFLQSDRAREMFEENVRRHLLYISSTWLDFKDESYHKVFGFWRANKERHAGVCRTAAKLYAAGVPMCAGTDLGAVVTFAGELADEIQRLHKIGLSNLEAVQAGTINAARLLGRDQSLGSVEPGKKADVAMVDGNPLEDLNALRRVRLVGKSGRWFRPQHPSLPAFWPEQQADFT